MKKKIYEQPTVQVVKLQHQCALLQASNPPYDSESWSRESDLILDDDDLITNEENL
ncbi:hypothetical protein SAMN02910409_2131 [Prevotellaceae bacterium HUN156]|nr:hypothetical protein SAMN02910409_2131 [Prevotellaceae bacterium HUN156]